MPITPALTWEMPWEMPFFPPPPRGHRGSFPICPRTTGDWSRNDSWILPWASPDCPWETVYSCLMARAVHDIKSTEKPLVKAWRERERGRWSESAFLLSVNLPPSLSVPWVDGPTLFSASIMVFSSLLKMFRLDSVSYNHRKIRLI